MSLSLKSALVSWASFIFGAMVAGGHFGPEVEGFGAFFLGVGVAVLGLLAGFVMAIVAAARASRLSAAAMGLVALPIVLLVAGVLWMF